MYLLYKENHSERQKNMFASTFQLSEHCMSPFLLWIDTSFNCKRKFPTFTGCKKNKEWENKRFKPWFRVTISSCDHLKPWGLKSEKSHYKEDFIHTVSVILSSAVYVHGSYSSKLQDSSVYVDFQLFCLVNNACLQLQRCTILIFFYIL